MVIVKNNKALPNEPVADQTALSTKKVSGTGLKKGFIAAFLAALVILAFFGIKSLQLSRQLASVKSQMVSLNNKQGNAQQTSAQDETAQLVAEVSKLMVLPQNEQPTIATVTDLAKLQGQPFFANAQVGDKVLIYSQAGKAILYRPSENKIIELAPLNIATSSPPSAGSTQTNQLTVEIRNGSGKAGAAQSLKTQLESDGGFSVVKIGNAKAVYPQTMVYVADGQASSAAVTRLQSLSSAAAVTTLPVGEPTTSADALLIIGKQ